MSSHHAADPAPAGRRFTLSRRVALAGTALAFTSLYLSAGVLTPLLVVYRQQWGFPPSLLTVAFAAYAAGFLAAVLTLGSLSDHLGRRPVLVAALVIQIAANLLFLVAPDVGWVIAGRIVQGVASGAATAAFTASLVELSPTGRKSLGAILGSVGLTGGLAVGSLVAGIAIQVTPSANTIIFGALLALTIAGAVVVALSPETVSRTPGAVRSMIPRIVIPASARKEFIAAAPVVAAVWMLAGLSGGLAPSLVRSVFHLDSGVLNGVAGFIAPAVSVITGFALARVGSRRAMTIGIVAAVLGSLGIIGGVFAASLPLMFIGQAIAGVAFGASFTAALSLIIPLVAPHQRAGVVAGIYVVSYTAFGVPIIIEGQLAGVIGDVPAVVGYTALTVLLAVISLFAQAGVRGRPTVTDPAVAAAGARTHSG
ncbi:MFS transporter [Leifsonia sp. NPDC058230]|uniref:MFS transporter n=1 Tax=Leifsonia sp. NPDC058230 TaxID=3346391 RepID=UPI0036DD848F